MNVKDLGMEEIILDYLIGLIIITHIFEARIKSQGRSCGNEGASERCYNTHFGGRGRESYPRNVGSLLKPEKASNGLSSGASRKQHSPTDTLILAQICVELLISEP